MSDEKMLAQDGDVGVWIGCFETLKNNRFTASVSCREFSIRSLQQFSWMSPD